MIPGLEGAEFVRYGMIHRNTYVNAPRVLEPTFETRRRPGLFFAGQMSGVEGYVESAASGLVAGLGGRLPGAGRGAARLPGGDRARRPRPLHRAERPRALPAHEHRLRPPARAPAPRPGQGEEAARDGPPRPREPGSLRGRARSRGRALRRGARPPPARPMRAAIEAFLRHLERERNASPHTIRAYGTDLAQLADHLRRELGPRALPRGRRPLAIRGFLAELHRRGLSRSSSARRLAGLRTFFRYLCREGRLPANPARLLATPRREKRIPAVLDEAQVQALLEVPGDGLEAVRGRAILELLYATGTRCAELVSLDVGEVDLEARTVRVLGKGGRERIVLFGQRAQEALRAWLAARAGAAAEDGRPLPERPGRPAHRPQRADARRPPRRAGGARPPLQPPHPAAQLRHPPPDPGGRPADHPGAARPREPRHHPALHARRHAAPARGVQEGAPTGMTGGVLGGAKPPGVGEPGSRSGALVSQDGGPCGAPTDRPRRPAPRGVAAIRAHGLARLSLR